jgi:hypothetical protein
MRKFVGCKVCVKIYINPLLRFLDATFEAVQNKLDFTRNTFLYLLNLGVIYLMMLLVAQILQQ